MVYLCLKCHGVFGCKCKREKLTLCFICEDNADCTIRVIPSNDYIYRGQCLPCTFGGGKEANSGVSQFSRNFQSAVQSHSGLPKH